MSTDMPTRIKVDQGVAYKLNKDDYVSVGLRSDIQVVNDIENLEAKP